MTRVINWLLFAVGLPLVVLILVAATEWTPDKAFFVTLTNEELLAVAVTLAGASGIDALTSKSRPGLETLQKGVGGLTILMGFITGFCYFIIKTHANHFPESVVQSLEVGLFVVTVIISFFSEVVA